MSPRGDNSLALKRMETNIPAESLNDPAVQRMNAVIKTCVHCGFCLPACPTYLETGSELDSPRGRIYLMKGALEAALPLDNTLAGHIDRCLGCQACVTACPSGVQYGELVTDFRARLEDEYRRAPLARLTRAMLIQVLPYSRRFRLAVSLGKVGKPFKRLMPKPMRAMLDLLPAEALPAPESFPQVISAQGQRRARIALLTGCVQPVLEPAINSATIRVLRRNGIEVVIPANQGCCGALAHHMGQKGAAQAFARRTLRTFPTDVDAVLTNAAGCGSTLKEYAHLMGGQPEEEQAREFVARVKDVSQFLIELGLSAPIPALPRKIRVAYHDACHLGHAQNIRAEPRQLLSSIPNLELVEIPEAEICCGSAGVYNITQPELSADLLRRKVSNIRAAGAEIVATGNIGCITQIKRALSAEGVAVLHTLQMLEVAYEGG